MVRQLVFISLSIGVVRAISACHTGDASVGVFVSMSQLYIHGWAFLPQAVTLGLFFISLPLQGLLWLGWRAPIHYH